MSAQLAEVIVLRDSNFRDPVATLRIIANEIEAGSYGEIGSIGLVLLGDTMEVFGMGEESTPSTVALLFNAAIIRLASAIEQHGKA